MSPPLDEDTRLGATGIQIITDAVDARVHAECMRIARRLRTAKRKVVGLLPTGKGAAVPSVAVQLGVALVELSGATVAYVDANVHLPGVSALAADDLPEAPLGAGRAKESVFRTRWLRGSLALLTPPQADQPGNVLPQLERVIFDGTEIFEHVLVDLTGFDLLGEQRAAAAMMHGVILVARSGRTTEQQIRTLTAEIPADKLLGVLIVGGRTPVR